MTHRTTLITTTLLAATLASGGAHAALQGRDLDGNIYTAEAYYDTDLNITWLADANYAQTSGYAAQGAMTWANAMTWAANLSFTDGINTYDNWRLPTTLYPDATCTGVYGYNCTGSEMGHLFYVELGGTAGQPIWTSVDPDVAKFTNLAGSKGYWSSTAYAPYPSYAWTISNVDLWQSAAAKTYTGTALAVSPGSVGIATVAVPEADTWAMLLTGLGLVGVATRRMKSDKV